ncbi:TlpA family protein disulfide reductase [Streptomonospora sp. PA3]|uniref:TlpA family protein disulfide reductase n=1 Tax=Streptomonospora sp. PA3 TaxID=2607326 RepID=UPI0012DC5780|nr:TlpA disulfide reductase family protein [Streptomonospora sp. PA3]MUL43678.1 TlpA family protein disulfide reductase [Streptomonospora sp. PA3]
MTGTAHRSPYAAIPRAALAVAMAAALAGCAEQLGGDADSAEPDHSDASGDGSATAFGPGEREPAPEVSGETLDGAPVGLDDYAGEVLVVNFWASWCSPCRAEMPVLMKVYTEYRDQGLEFLGVNIKDDRTAAKAFERNLGVTYPSIYDQPGAVPQAFADTVPPQAIPSTVVIDREGDIAARVIGATTYDQLTGLVEPVLAEGGAPQAR